MKKTYIGTKVVQGEPMSHNEFLKDQNKQVPPDEHDRPGFKVFYDDGYVSWSPHAVFEGHYREITPKEADLVCSIEPKKREGKTWLRSLEMRRHK